MTTSFEPSNDDVINKAYLETKLYRIEGHLSFIEKDYNEFKLPNDKKSEEVFNERAVETTRQTLCGKGSIDNYDNADEVIKMINFLTKLTQDVNWFKKTK